MYCYIKNPSSATVASDSEAISNCGTINVQCTVVCNPSIPACCNIEGQYTWQVYDDPPSGFSCDGDSINPGAVSKIGNAYYVNWSAQTYCTQACIGSAAGWNLGGEVSPNTCCGDDSGEYAIDCQDNNEGFCVQASDTDACCDQTGDCVYDNICYSQDDQIGEWKCGALVAGIWHDIETPWADIKINNGSPYTTTRDVVLNLNFSDNEWVAEYGLSNDNISYVWEFCQALDFAAYYNFNSIQDCQVLDQSENNNNGSIYGNTRLLMHFDEDDSATAGDKSAYSNDGAIYGDTMFLMHFDEGSGNPKDSSSYGNDGTRYGATWRTSDCKSGYCLSFDGGNDYINLQNVQFPSGNSPRSVSFWVKDVASSQNHYIFFYGKTGVGGQPSTYGQRFSLGIDNARDNHLKVVGYGNDWDTGYHLPTGIWKHVTFTFDGSTIKLYIDGSFLMSTTMTFNTVLVTNAFIGVHEDMLAWFQGRLDEFAVYSKALSPGEVEAMYEESKAKFIEWVPGKNGSALEFDGVDDYVQTLLNISSGDLTLNFWFKWNGAGDSTREILLDDWDGSERTLAFVYEKGTVDQLVVYDSATNYFTTGITPTANVWYHVGAVINSSTVEVYVDSELKNSSSASPTYSNSNYVIGRAGTAAALYFNGTIDEVSIYSKPLSQVEVETLYNESRAKFMEDVVPGKSGNALEFNGMDYYVDVSDSNSLSFGDGSSDNPFSVSAWIFMNENGNRAIFSKYNSGGGGREYTFYFDSSSKLNLFLFDESVDTYQWIVTDSAISVNEWHYITSIYDGRGGNSAWQGMKIYVDGNEVSVSDGGSTTPYTAMENLATSVEIGSYNGGTSALFNGIIDEIRIYNRSLTPEEIGQFYGEVNLTKNWTLSEGDGVKTVYFQVNDTGGNSVKTSDNIILDTTGPMAYFEPPLPEYIGPGHDEWEGNKNGSIMAFNVSWTAENTSEINCYQVQYNTSTVSWTNWTIDGTNCTPRTEWTFGPEEPVEIEFFETYFFRVKAVDNVENLGPWSPLNYTTIVDVDSPELNFTTVDQDTNNLLDVGLVSHEDVDYIVVTSSAMDSISDLKEHYIDYCKVYGGVEECKTEDCGPRGPEEVGSCNVTIDFEENTVIKLRGTAKDLTGNWNISPDRNRYWFITDHALVNFIAKQLDIIIGDSALLKVQVRNIQNSFDNITLNLSGYQFASFADTGEGELSSDKRSLWIGLNPYEEKDLYVRVFSSSIGESKIYLNATSLLTGDGELCWDVDCVKDSDMVSITIGYTFEFPGLNIWGILLLVMVSLIVYSRLERKLFL